MDYKYTRSTALYSAFKYSKKKIPHFVVLQTGNEMDSIRIHEAIPKIAHNIEVVGFAKLLTNKKPTYVIA